MSLTLHITDAPTPEQTAHVFEGLFAFNTAKFGEGNRQSIGVFLYDGDGQMQGGLTGMTGWGWLFTQWLYVPEAMRGQGLARRLLHAAEEEARQRGCHGAWIDTLNPDALRIYQHLGYTIFGEIPDYVAGFSRHYLQKKL